MPRIISTIIKRCVTQQLPMCLIGELRFHRCCHPCSYYMPSLLGIQAIFSGYFLSPFTFPLDLSSVFHLPYFQFRPLINHSHTPTHTRTFQDEMRWDQIEKERERNHKPDMATR